MSACPGPDELTAGARPDVLAHLADCAACRRIAAELVRGTVLAAAEEDRVGRYVLGEPLGAGAMGVVFRARDPLLDRAVALKIIDGQGLDDAARTRLLREAQAMAKVSAPGVVACYDAGIADGDVFVAMELVRGENLRAWAARKRPWRDVVRVAIDAARGLAAAHAAGLVHRDVKPDNILVRADGGAAIGDFGLARADPAAEVAIAGLGIGTKAAGTPRYLAPEVLAGKPATAASDQYAFCLTLQEVLAGNDRADGDAATVPARRATPKRRGAPTRGGIPDVVRRVIARGLSDDRYRSMSVLADDLQRALGSRRRSTISAIAIGAVAIAAAGGIALAVVVRGRAASRAAAPACAPPDLLATHWPPAAQETVRAQLDAPRFARVDRVIRQQLALHRSLFPRACTEPVARACLDSAAEDVSLAVAALAEHPTVIADDIYALLQVEQCRPGVTHTLPRAAPPSLAPARRSLVDAQAQLEAERIPLALAEARLLAWADPIDLAFAADRAALLATIHAWAEDAPAAAAELARARSLAAASGDGVRRAKLLIALAQFYGAQRNDSQLAADLVAEAAPVVAQLGDQRISADLAATEAVIALASNHLPAAAAAIGRAYDLDRAIFGDDRPELGPILLLRAQISTQSAEPDAAARDYEAAVDLYSRALGPTSPDALNARMNLATNELTAHRVERGRAEYEGVIAALAASPEADAPSLVADARSGLCSALSEAQVDAIDACRAAVAAAESAYGATHPRTGTALTDLGQALLAASTDAPLVESIAVLRRAEQLTAPMGDDEHARASFLLARALVAHRESPAEAHRLLDLAIPILRKSPTRAPLVELVPQWYAPWRTLAAYRYAQR